MSKPKPKKKNKTNPNFIRTATFWILLAFLVLMITNSSWLGDKLTYTEFYNMVQSNSESSAVLWVKQAGPLITGEYQTDNGTPARFHVYVPDRDDVLLELLRKNVTAYEIEPARTFWTTFIVYFGPVILLIVFFWYMTNKGDKMGARVWGFGKSRAVMMDKNKNGKITFKNVAGVDEAKEELHEVVEFLQDPKKYQRLGGRFPKGVLLVGPPGCGKTLLAKAVAGEAGVPFFSISGSDFVEMFVGVGASRVRDLFGQAKKAAKIENKGSIIFIDEIDAVGRQRFSGLGGGHDEREQTLNQLLTEMDGFQTQAGIIVMAATNRPDVLDPALLRPGRFDRHIVINAPDIKGREEILNIHLTKIRIAKNVNVHEIAKRTPGFSGADLENLSNEGALLAARRNKDAVEQTELEEAIERVLMGPEKKSRIILDKEKEITAYHEAGHAILSLLLPEVDSMAKVSIIPRGLAGGYTFMPPKEDKRYKSKKELLGEIVVALGGRVSEELNLGDITTGAMGDLAAVTDLSRRMVCDFGMSERLGNHALGNSHAPVFLGRDMLREKDYSEDTAKIVDEEVKRIVDECYARAKSIMIEHDDKVKKLAQELLEKEVLTADQVCEITGIINENSPDKNNKQEPDSSANA